MIVNRTDYIRTIEAVSAAAEIVLKVVVELERLAVLHGEHAIQAPAVFQFLPIATHLGKIVSEVPSGATGNIEIRRCIFEVGTSAVVGLSCVRLEVFAVTGIVHGTRPNEVENGGKTVPTVQAETGLEGVVVRFTG